MNKSDRPIRKFSPGTFQSDEQVIEQFVVRKHELDIVLEVLRGNIDSPSCQHVLVVAPRGRGKTMLLTRIAAELNTNHELSECLLPVRFMEESHEIFSLADFWLDTLFYLARESAKHDPTLAGDLRETHADLTTRWQEEALADRGRARCLGGGGAAGQKTRPHGREPTGALRKRGQKFRLGVARRIAIGAPDHAARHRHESFQRVWTTRSSRSSSYSG